MRQIGLWDWVQNFREILSALTMKYGFDNFGNGHGNQGDLEIGFSQKSLRWGFTGFLKSLAHLALVEV